MLGRIAWFGIVAGGVASLLARLIHSSIVGWMGLVLIGVALIAMCWLGAYALEDLRANEKDDTEAT